MNIAILILAAGNSSRMGEPKQLLPWKNTFLLNHIINNVVLLDNSELYAVLGANHSLIKSKVNCKDVNIILNEHWQLGLGSSIAIGVKTILEAENKFDSVLITLGDQPLIQTKYLGDLIDSFKVGKKKIIASNYGNNRLGVPAIFDNYYFEELSNLSQDRGAKNIINNHIGNVTTLDACTLIADIDTKEDYNKLYKANH